MLGFASLSELPLSALPSSASSGTSTASATTTATGAVVVLATAAGSGISTASGGASLLSYGAASAASSAITVSATTVATAQSSATTSASGAIRGFILISPTYKLSIDRRFHVDAAYTVIQKADGTFVNAVVYKQDDPQWAGALNVWRGGYENVVDPATAVSLTAAGYTVV